MTAVWTLWHDPDRRRGWLILASLFGWAFLKISLMASFLMIGLAILASIWHPGGGVPPAGALMNAITTALGIAFFGLFLAWCFSFVSIAGGLACRRRLWVGPELRFACEEGIWPPRFRSDAHHLTNRMRMTTLIAVVPVVCLPTVFVCGLMDATINRSAFLLAQTIVVVPIALAFTKIYNILQQRVLATSPAGCWPTDPEEFAPTL